MTMKNLETMLNNELAERIAEAMENYGNYLTVKEAAKVVEGVKPLESYRAKITAKVNKGYTGKDIAKLSEVSNETRIVKSITITVNYTKSSIWGYCPTAELSVEYTNGNHEHFTGKRASGRGYDKESSAIASVLNQCHSLLRAMYIIKNDNAEQSNRQCLGYGSGYGILPAFEDGVGFSCHRSIMEKLGYTYNHTASGKAFDVYTFVKEV
jgi:hypothetical protein